MYAVGLLASYLPTPFVSTGKIIFYNADHTQIKLKNQKATFDKNSAELSKVERLSKLILIRMNGFLKNRFFVSFLVKHSSEVVMFRRLRKSVTFNSCLFQTSIRRLGGSGILLRCLDFTSSIIEF